MHQGFRNITAAVLAEVALGIRDRLCRNRTHEYRITAKVRVVESQRGNVKALNVKTGQGHRPDPVALSAVSDQLTVLRCFRWKAILESSIRATQGKLEIATFLHRRYRPLVDCSEFELSVG